MKLRDLLHYDHIVIQGHNDPDADALASGFALLRFFALAGKKARFVYGGRAPISKPNLVLMKQLLNIPAEHVSSLEEEPDLLITVDCQYGESNVQKFPYKELAIIDHHEVAERKSLPPLNHVMENYGSCATVVYELLKEEDYPFEEDSPLQTALYYGLFTDTVRFQELWHPADKDMWEDLTPAEGILSVLKYSNIATADLEAIGNAFTSYEMSPTHKYGISEVMTGDSNILGIVSDTLLEVDSLNVCVCYAFLADGIKISVRSCIKEVHADELAKAIAQGMGNAGGHLMKAGGFLPYKRVFPQGCETLPEKRAAFVTELKKRLDDYFEQTDVIPAGLTWDVTGMEVYRKLPVFQGTVRLSKHFPKGTKLKVRTLEGDTDVTVSEDNYLMIGTHEEPYPIEAEKFHRKYKLTGRPFAYHEEYSPNVRNYTDGSKLVLEGITEECVTLGESYIYAKQLTRRVHVFNSWNPNRYIYGKPGDWFAVLHDELSDYYVIQSYIFDETYEKVEK